jgi:lipoprotein-anchoring transpeptidase ErfK/SrfK
LSAYGSDGFYIYNKFNAMYMSGGTNKFGWMIPGIGWASFFYSPGIAIHSTFWHNNFGEPTSHGCINVSPEDAKWIYRWTSPSVGYQEGSKDVGGTTIGTRVKVIEY